MRFAFKTICLLLLLVLLNSCVDNNDFKRNELYGTVPISSKNQTVQLKWLAPWYGEGERQNLITDFVRDFSFLNQEINITLDFPQTAMGSGGWWVLANDYLGSVIKNNQSAYDIMLIEPGMYRVQAEILGNPDWIKDYFVDLKEYDWFIEAHKSEIINDKNLLGKYGGILPGPFIEGNMHVLYTDKRIEEKLGIKIKHLGMDIDDFISYAKAVNTYNQNHSDKIQFIDYEHEFQFTDFVKNLFLSEHQNTGFVSQAYAKECLANVLVKLEELAEYAPINIPLNNKVKMVNQSNNILFYLMPTWAFNVLAVDKVELCKNLKPSTIPSMPGKLAPYYPGSYGTLFGIYKNSKNKEAALTLIKGLCQNEVGEKWVKTTLNPTGLNIRMASTEFGEDDFSQFYRYVQNNYQGIKEFDIIQYFNGDDNARLDYYDREKVNYYLKVYDVMAGRKNASQALRELPLRY